jgi:hypothetical protein
VVTVTVSGISSGGGTFTLTSTNLTVTQGNQGSSTITVTPKNGYTGTVDLSFDTSNDSALQNLCYEFTNEASDGDGTVTITGTGAIGTQLTLDTNPADCNAFAAVRTGGKPGFHSFKRMHSGGGSGNSPAPVAPAAIAFGGLLMAGILGRYSRKLRSLACVVVLVTIGLAVSACGGNSNTVTVPTGTYTVTVTGVDSASASITSTTSFTFTVN